MTQRVTPGPLSQRNEDCILKHLFIAAVVMIGQNRKHPRCLSSGKELTVVHSYLEFYSAIKRNKSLIYATTRRNVKRIMLSGKSQ